MYDKEYYQGDSAKPGSDVCRKYDMHWWSHRYYAGLVRKYCKRGTVLELGCAHGYLLSFLDPARYHKIGKDLSSYALTYAREQNPSSDFYEGSVEDLKEIRAGSVDVVVTKYVLEHLAQPEKAIAESFRVLKSEGHIILSVPNTSSLLRRAKGENWIGCRDKTHRSVLSPERWNESLRQAGFTVLKNFSDGFWDVPYIRCVPRVLQFLFLGWPTVFQTLLVGQWIPVKLGEDLIIVARK